MPKKPHSNLDYKSAGVDVEAGNELVDQIKPIAGKTETPGVIKSIGGFGSLFELPAAKYRQPVLVSGTDGVGTKLKLAVDMRRHDTVGIDLVAMCANDVVVQGAEPLFFLDYYATSKLNVDTAASVVEGIGKGCEMAGMALIGGETAEMPGMYASGDYDLAGFCVGIVEKDRIIDGSACSVGDRLIGLASSGPHSNGYSLIHRILELHDMDLTIPFHGSTLGDSLLEPTRIYVKPILELIKNINVHAMAHITGGGITENLPRVLPENSQAVINLDAWERPPVFYWLQKNGGVRDPEMLKTFNCGIGMILCVAPEEEMAALKKLAAMGEKAFSIGVLESAKGAPSVRYC